MDISTDDVKETNVEKSKRTPLLSVDLEDIKKLAWFTNMVAYTLSIVDDVLPIEKLRLVVKLKIERVLLYVNDMLIVPEQGEDRSTAEKRVCDEIF